MQRILFNLTLIFGAVILLSSCSKKDENTARPFEGVDELLWPYFERFEDEANLRGVEIDLEARGITGVVSNISTNHVAGVCNYHSDNANHVIVDSEFWVNSSELLKELIIFHELGHCYLLRPHRDEMHSDGTCMSIMRSGLSDCDDNYLTITRENYLNELFE